MPWLFPQISRLGNVGEHSAPCIGLVSSSYAKLKDEGTHSLSSRFVPRQRPPLLNTWRYLCNSPKPTRRSFTKSFWLLPLRRSLQRFLVRSIRRIGKSASFCGPNVRSGQHSIKLRDRPKRRAISPGLMPLARSSITFNSLSVYGPIAQRRGWPYLMPPL